MALTMEADGAVHAEENEEFLRTKHHELYYWRHVFDI
jgi:hypothetical protein